MQNMPSDKDMTPWEGTKKDFQQSWRLLKENYRAFLGTELFAIACFLLIFFIYALVVFIANPDTQSQFSRRFVEETSFRWFTLSLGYIILIAFINCQTGLAHDIMSSGDMYADFKSSFSYFAQNWWKYVLLSIFTGTISMGVFMDPRMQSHGSLNPPFFNFGMIVLIIGVLILAFLWHCMTIQSLASINAQPSFFKAITESFRVFKANPKRVLSTWGIYFLIFSAPSVVYEIIIAFTYSDIQKPLLIVPFVILFNLFVIFIGLPLRALLATGLYNNINFKRVVSDHKTPT